MRWTLAMIGGALLCSTVVEARDPRDPFEPYNRFVYGMNRAMDGVLFKPLSILYNSLLPETVQNGIANFFSNIDQIPITANHLLQGEGKKGLRSGVRLVANTSFGVFGFFDVAQMGGLYKEEADFGQTLAKWGYRHSAYFVLPLLGPSTVRDSVGKGGDFLMSPWAYWHKNHLWWSAKTVELMSNRAALLKKEAIFSEMVVDEYRVVREAILDRRANLIDSGNSGFDLLADDPLPLD